MYIIHDKFTTNDNRNCKNGINSNALYVSIYIEVSVIFFSRYIDIVDTLQSISMTALFYVDNHVYCKLNLYTLIRTCSNNAVV